MARGAKSVAKKTSEDVKKKLSSNDKIKQLEEELSKTKVNKRTEAAVGQLKAKIAKLKSAETQKVMKSRGGGDGYSVRKSGDGTVVLVGFPSVGKSTLLNALTNATSEVGAYAFTTLTVVPGMLNLHHAQIQVLDVPGIVSGAAAGTGRGKEVLQVMRSADLVCFVIDVFHPEHFELLKKEVYDTGIRLDQRDPDVKIRKTGKGGIDIGATVPLSIDKDAIVSVLKEYGIINASVVIRQDITIEQLIDVIEQNKVYIPSMRILNKVDMADDKTLDRVRKLIKPHLEISAQKRYKTEELKQLIFENLRLVRVFMKEQFKKADMDEPMILRKGDTVKRVLEKLHRDFITNFKYARMWGKSAKFDGQIIKSLDHKVADGDVIEIHTR